jgi:nicotinamidase-related amidase
MNMAMPADDGRLEALEALRNLARRPALVTIDLHRGHLDPGVATLPLEAEASGRVMEAARRIMFRARSLGLPIVHVTTRYADVAEITANPYWRQQAGKEGSVRARIADHQAPGAPGLEMMPGVVQPGDLLLDTKRRYDCFVATDLEFVLRTRDVDSLLIIGVNTNSCVLATSIAASVRDYAVFVLSDGVATMMERSFHDAALAIIGGSFGWVIDSDGAFDALERGAG